MIVTVLDTSKQCVLIWTSIPDFGTYYIYVEMPLINAHANVSSRVRGLIFGRSHLHPYFVYVSTEVFGKSGHMCRLCLCPEPMLLHDVMSTRIVCVKARLDEKKMKGHLPADKMQGCLRTTLRLNDKQRFR